MVRYFFLWIIFCIPVLSQCQDLTGIQLLDKAIAYHDPEGDWASFNADFIVTMSTPDGKKRVSNISMNLLKEYFRVKSTKEDEVIEQTINKGACTLMFNGSTDIAESDKKKHRLSCERAHMYKDYYTYLYGLPMKLKDPGTILDSKVQRKRFKQKEYLVLKVNYTPEVGKDTWYFYFNPKTYAMEMYQFYHDEAANDGEYIVLSGEELVGSIKMPKTRAWYYNTDDKHLGTDVLTKGSAL